MYSEVAWVIVSSGTQFRPQIILDPDYLPDCLSVSCDYRVWNFQISKLVFLCCDEKCFVLYVLMKGIWRLIVQNLRIINKEVFRIILGMFKTSYSRCYFRERIANFNSTLTKFNSQNILLQTAYVKLSSFSWNKTTDIRMSFASGSQKTYVKIWKTLHVAMLI